MNPDTIRRLPSFDTEYHFGHPKTYLTWHEQAQLLVLRSKWSDTIAWRRREHGQPIESGECDFGEAGIS